MAWDDAPPDSDFKAKPTGAWDSQPPDEDLVPKWSDLPGNIIPDAKEVGKGALDMGLRTAKGIYDLPEDAIHTGEQVLKGENPMDTPLAEDAKTVGGGLMNAVTSIPKQLGDLASKEAWVKHPVQNAMTTGVIVAPFLGGEEAAVEGAAKAGVGEEAAAAAPKELPVIPPGSKTGDPHALFSYNDQFGPGGKPRSMYTMFGDPEHPVFKQRTPSGAGGHGSTIPKEDIEALGVPIVGREPRTVGKWEPIEGEAPKVVPMGGEEPKAEPASRIPPDPNAPPATEPKAKVDPLQDVKDYLKKTQGKVEAKPGWQEKAAKYVKNEVADLRAKDIGLRDPMIRSLDPKRPLEALKKAEDLMGYAGEKGYFKPGLTDVARKGLIESEISKTGKNIGAIRNIGGQRGTPPIAEIREAIKNELTDNYGAKASREIETVLGDFDRMAKKDASFQGLSDIATYLNGEKKTFNKIGQNPGPTTDAANTLGRMNNDALRKLLTPEERDFYTNNLRDFGAHKKLEQMVASSSRRAMTGRGAPGGALAALWQQLWDRGGYRMAGNVANRVSGSVLRNPGKIKTLPDFFEQLAHDTGEELDDTIKGMSKGGVVPDDVKRYIGSKC